MIRRKYVLSAENMPLSDRFREKKGSELDEAKCEVHSGMLSEKTVTFWYPALSAAED
jgi:hypothetical protein